MINLNKLSTENLERIQKVLKIILDELEIQEINRLVGNKIPIGKFEKEEFSRDDILAIFNRINEKDKIMRLRFFEEDFDFTNLEFYPPKTELEKMEFLAQKRVESERYISFIVINLEKLKKIKKEVDKKINEKERIMEKESGRPIELFTKNVVKQPTLAEIQEEAEQGNRWLAEQSQQTQRHKEALKHKRILNATQDKYEHAIDTIIERVESYENGRKNISIHYYYFNFEDTMDDSKMLERFFERLKNAGCFQDFGRVNWGMNTEFEFNGIDIDKFKKYKRKHAKDFKKENSSIKSWFLKNLPEIIIGLIVGIIVGIIPLIIGLFLN